MAMDQYNDDDDEIIIQYMIYIFNIKYSQILLLCIQIKAALIFKTPS